MQQQTLILLTSQSLVCRTKVPPFLTFSKPNLLGLIVCQILEQRPFQKPVVFPYTELKHGKAKWARHRNSWKKYFMEDPTWETSAETSPRRCFSQTFAETTLAGNIGRLGLAATLGLRKISEKKSFFWYTRFSLY